MKLSYRGHTYDHQSCSVAATKTLTGKYRGNRSTLNLFQQLPVHRAKNLTYRGAKVQA